MFLLVHKPKWYTSFDIVDKIKKIYHGEKVGHAGTLDPMATGLLIIAIGKDTKRLKEFVGLDKTYLATIDFSKKSDTRDMDFWEEYREMKSDEKRWNLMKKDEIWWKKWPSQFCEVQSDEGGWSLMKSGTFTSRWVIRKKNRETGISEIIGEKTWTFHIPTQQEIQEKFESILWYHPMPLTPFSAKKWKGKKLYEYAREGNPIYVDVDMQLIDFEILHYDFPELKIKFHVGSGAYIRSYAHWIGEQFWLWWILTSLERVKVGEIMLIKNLDSWSLLTIS